MNKKHLFLTLLPLLILILSGCNITSPTEESHMLVNTGTMQPLPIGPTKEFTTEDYINTANDLLAAVTDSYQKMSDLAADSSAPKKGIKAAEKVTEKYAARIEELTDKDFSTWSADDLSSLSSELSDIITAIREARDLLNP